MANEADGKAGRAAVADESALSDAARIADDLEAIRGVLRDAAWRHAREHQVPLTPPQVRVLQILVDELRGSGAGLSLSELSGRMGMAHSTVSGIVDRLERRKLLKRSPRPEDRRFVMVELTQPVKGWLQDDLPRSRLAPLASALASASADECQAILRGLEVLRGLLSAAKPG